MKSSTIKATPKMKTVIGTVDQLRTALVTNECMVTFTKVNGETRNMLCTLKPSALPPAPSASLVTMSLPVVVNPDIVNVWCTDKAAWRSFRVSNFITASISAD
jgi:hypothetical protein